ncbi:uncharacterized protein B0H18DRAFT_620032 [Fomitopsis serialis]|uniref:uncharacterized protein n=1 Tax=Fomitopsis serialis TaxID=139415 RepID=UPI002007812B|nr:uncharacterized protein B0H18DRAFT_620032 [Neoantrodia serialis]KAH9919919.1 hypothetical protein B0H18DRAFT_620032 [Neoantrodia serialis]
MSARPYSVTLTFLMIQVPSLDGCPVQHLCSDEYEHTRTQNGQRTRHVVSPLSSSEYLGQARTRETKSEPTLPSLGSFARSSTPAYIKHSASLQFTNARQTDLRGREMGPGRTTRDAKREKMNRNQEVVEPSTRPEVPRPRYLCHRLRIRARASNELAHCMVESGGALWIRVDAINGGS